MVLTFASISAIDMNHYSHPKEFYLYSFFDALLVFPIVAVATGLLYPIFFKQEIGKVNEFWPLCSPRQVSSVFLIFEWNC